MDINAIKSKLQSFQPKPRTTYEKVDYKKVLFKPQPGKYQIRIVPSKFDKKNPFREVYFHYGLQKFKMLALTNWNEQDPIVDLVKKLKETREPENWKLAKRLEPKLRVFVPIVVRGQEQDGVRLWEIGMEIYKDLLKLVDDEDYGGDYTDVANGRDFTIEIEKSNVGGREVNKVTSVKPKPKTTNLSDDATLVEKLLNEQPDILAINKKYKYDELKDFLQKFIAPEENNNETEDQEDDNNEVNDLPFEVSTEQVKSSASEKFNKLFENK